MTMAETLDRVAIAAACQRHGARRLRVFGSATTEEFEPGRSDVDFLVEFHDGRGGYFDDYFDLKTSLEEITGIPVDLISAKAVRNPFFARMARSQAVEIYAS